MLVLQVGGWEFSPWNFHDKFWAWPCTFVIQADMGNKPKRKDMSWKRNLMEGKEAESEEGTEVEGFHPFVC